MNTTVIQPQIKEWLPGLSMQSFTNTELLAHDKRSRQLFLKVYLFIYMFFGFVLVLVLIYRKLYIFNAYSLMSLKISIHHETITTIYTISISITSKDSLPSSVIILCDNVNDQGPMGFSWDRSLPHTLCFSS